LAVKIRLRRMGARNRPNYRFVATDSRMPRDGRFIEILGHYNPIDKPGTVGVKEERIYYWLKQGATLTDTVNGIFRQIGLWRKWEMMKRGEDASQVTLLTQLKEKSKRKKRKKGAASEAAAVAAEVKAPAQKAEEAKPKEEKKEEQPEVKAAEKEEKKEEKKEEEKSEAKGQEKDDTEEKKEDEKPEK
jgi:small subunit ribosomal protein S16